MADQWTEKWTESVRTLEVVMTVKIFDARVDFNTEKAPLSFDEALILDGRVNEKLQAIIDTMKAEAAIGLPVATANGVIRLALKAGRLRIVYKGFGVRFCPQCDRFAGYAKYPRNGKNHCKGDTNLGKPLSFPSYKFSVGGSVCQECSDEHGIVDMIISHIIDNDLQIELQARGAKTRWVKDDQQQCLKCKETMFESEMKRLHAVMGQGTYPGGCPHCGAKSLPFGPSHENTHDYRMIRVSENA